LSSVGASYVGGKYSGDAHDVVCSAQENGKHMRTRDGAEDEMRSRTSINDYWDVVGALWDVIEIYEGPEVFQQTYNSVPRQAGLMFAAHFCQHEVCTGGFEQFFWNPTGVLALAAVEGFREIGLVRLSGVVQQAMDLLGSPYPCNRGERKVRLSLVPKGAFDALDETSYSLIKLEEGGFKNAANRYVRETGQIPNRDVSKSNCDKKSLSCDG